VSNGGGTNPWVAIVFIGELFLFILGLLLILRLT
jgi:hypothetical protein